MTKSEIELLLINKKLLRESAGTKALVTLGFLMSVLTTKAYPIIIILGLLLPHYYYMKREIQAILVLFIIFSLISLLPVVATVGFEKYYFVTFVYQSSRVPNVINVFNSELYPSLPYQVGLTLRKIDLIILATVMLWYIVTIHRKYKFCVYKIRDKLPLLGTSSSIVLFSTYLVFSPVVSPQNYFLLVFLCLYLAETKNQYIKRIALTISVILFIFMLFVYPSFTFFGYPLGEIVGIFPQISSLIQLILSLDFVGKIISAILYPTMLAILVLLSHSTNLIIDRTCKDGQ